MWIFSRTPREYPLILIRPSTTTIVTPIYNFWHTIFALYQLAVD